MSESVSGALALPGRPDGVRRRVGLARRTAQRLGRRLIFKPATELRDEELRRSAIIFAPHFDDETLGCGGTIAKKRAMGADVTIAFLTDGTSSHADLIDADELAALRTAEGYAAAQVLGIGATDVHVFGFEDSQLVTQAEATQRVGDLLQATKPQDVFVPYDRDRLSDHVATHRIVMSAIEATGMDVTVYEYLIWFWHHWPWASTDHLPRRSIWANLRDSARATRGLLRERRCYVRLTDAEQRTKHAALAAHRSQVTRLRLGAEWPILSDVWDGDFLACCFREQELFVRRERRTAG